MVRNVVRVATLSVLPPLLIPAVALAQVSLTTIGTPVTQNFDSLATITGWYGQFGTNATNPTAYTASTRSIRPPKSRSAGRRG